MTDQIISQDGYNKLKDEMEMLSTVRRREIADRIESAKELGDLSENAEYSDAKEAQAFNEGRIAEIANLLKNIKVVGNGVKGTVGMGSVVTAETNSMTKTFTIVSFNEADPLNGKISNESPLGIAINGMKAGDSVCFSTPKGESCYKILKVE